LGKAIYHLASGYRREHAGVSRILALGQAIRATTGLIHELQRERGLSSGVLASEGSRFAGEWTAQLVRSQDAWKKTVQAWERLPADWLEGPLQEALGRAWAAEPDLRTLRDDVRAQSVTAAAAVLRYCGLVEGFLAVVAQGPGSSAHPQVTPALLALFHFVAAKETLGQQRALGTSICSQGHFEPFQWERFRELEVQRAEALDLFRIHAPPEGVRALEVHEGSRSAAGVRSLMNPILLGPDGPGDLPAPDVWFRGVSDSLDDLRRMELRLLDDLDDLCTSVQAAEARVPQPEASLEFVSRRMEAQRLEDLVTVLDELVVKSRILSLDAGLDAIDRATVARGAQALFSQLTAASRQARSILAGAKGAASTSPKDAT
jgi:hypothetical protein